MPAPANLADLLGLLQRSRLLGGDALGQVAERLRTGDLRGQSVESVFRQLAAEQTLTTFQARQLAAGRWRGLVLRNYRLLKRLGSGGMGRVFLGEHVTFGRRVAVKVLAEDLAENPVARERLIREARAAATLDHPNIVRVFDIETEVDPPYLVMEYVDGLSLQAAVALTGTFCAEAVALVGRQVASALQHAWERGLVHRDVKPANLLLDRTGQVRVLDLGIVLGDFDSQLTAAGDQARQILGTLDYLSPEQAVDSSAVDCRADIYGLGATLYFLLAGQPPFAEYSPTVRLMYKQQFEPRPVHQLRPDVPETLSAVIARMMARDPDDRLPTPALVADALAPFAVPVSGFPDDIFESAQQKQRPVPPKQPLADGSQDHAAIHTEPGAGASLVTTPPPTPRLQLKSVPPAAASRARLNQRSTRRLAVKTRRAKESSAILWASFASAAVAAALLLLVLLLAS